MFNALLLTTAGVVILSATLASRAVAWHAANKTATPAEPVRAIASTPGHFATYDPNENYVYLNDWLAPAVQINAPMLRPDYEGLDDETDGDAWVDALRHAGHDVARAVVPMSRAYVRATNDEFERFDRITTRMMSRVDTICKSTIQRWQDEWEDYSRAHEFECSTIEIERIKDWCTSEVAKLPQDFRLAEALLVS